MLKKWQTYIAENKNDLFGIQKRRSEKILLREVQNYLAHIPEGQAILDDLKKHKVKIKFDDQIDQDAYYHLSMRHSRQTGRRTYDTPLIVLNHKENNIGKLVYSLCHEARHIQQYLSGNIGLETIGDHQNACLKTRVIEADAEAFAVDILYRLKQVDMPEAWDYHLSSSYQAIGLAYEQSVTKNPDHQNNGQAQYAAFKAWRHNMAQTHFYDIETVKQWQSEVTSFLAHAHVPAIIRNMSEAECQAIGQLSKVNYMQVPDAEPITDIMQDMTMPPEVTQEDQTWKKLYQTLQQQPRPNVKVNLLYTRHSPVKALI